MPGGYIDRSLTIKGLSDAYHSINLMDILRFKRRFPGDIDDKIIEDALTFAQESGIRQYWAEQKNKKYALGFWAEALYHSCTLYPDAKYRDWLAEAIFDLEKLGQGIPPSLLGANAEIDFFKGAGK